MICWGKERVLWYLSRGDYSNQLSLKRDSKAGNQILLRMEGQRSEDASKISIQKKISEKSVNSGRRTAFLAEGIS